MAETQTPVVQEHRAKDFERLDALNDELHVIRRLLENPMAFGIRPEVTDCLRMAVQYTHSRYQELAFDMRNRIAVASATQT